MRIFKTLIIAAFAFATAAGTLLAADDPLEIHGGGRIGFVVNSKGGSTSGFGSADNKMGTMPNYGESNYLSLSFSKKVTAENGAWAKSSMGIDNHNGDADADLRNFQFRLRDFHVDFGGLDFLPAGAVLWGGLRGYGAGWVGQQDYGFIGMAGIGAGIQNIGGVFSLAYMAEDNNENDHSHNGAWVDADNDPSTPNVWQENADKNEGVVGLGERTMHNIIASVNVPMADVYAAFGYSKKGKPAGEKNLTAFYVGGIYHAPVLSLNIGAQFSTNNYAKEIYDADYDTMFKGNHFSGVGADKANKATGFSLAAWTVADLAEGLYIAPAIRYDMLKSSDDTSYYGKNTLNKIGASFRISKALTKNIAFVPTLGYKRVWDKEKVLGGADAPDKPLQVIQATAAVELGLNTGYGAAQKLQFYGTLTNIDSKHKKTGNGAGYENKANRVDFGMLMTFGF